MEQELAKFKLEVEKKFNNSKMRNYKFPRRT